MNYTDKHIVEAYSELFEGLSSSNKIELIESLSRLLEAEKKTKDNNFFKSFGALSSEKPAEQIIAEIKLERKFRNREIKF